MSITLSSISEAWQEIEKGKGGKSKASKFFVELAKWQLARINLRYDFCKYV